MNDEQANDIIESVMKVHWPKWEFKGQELKVWIEELRNPEFDFETAKDAINELYKNWKPTRYPKMPDIMGAIRKLAYAKRPKKRLVQLFTIIRQDGRRRWWPFVGNANTPREGVEKRAEQLAAEANRLWPDEESHIIQYYSTDVEEEPDEQESQEEHQDTIPF